MASVYALGQPARAFDAICDEAHRTASPEQRWMFDIQANARKLALSEGYDSAVSAMDRYRLKCRLQAFAPFWAAIPLAKMEYLKRGIHVLEENYVLPEKDKIALAQLAEKYKNDPYIDYAQYFLHRFDKVKRAELLALSGKSSDDASTFFSKRL